MRRFILLVTILLLVAMAAPLSARAQGSTYGTYIVQPGDTLFSIASRFNVSVSELATINGFYDVNIVYVGQVLRLPAPLSGTVVQPAPITGPIIVLPTPVYSTGVTTTYTAYVVRVGDNLERIATLYRTTVGAILAANSIANSNLLYVGQVLVIPQIRAVVSTTTTVRVSGSRVYIVQPGDNLFGIAARFGRDIYSIARANRLLNLNAIYIGQALIIP